MASLPTSLSHTKMQAHISFHTHADGSVSIVATGRHGTLTLMVIGGEKGPTVGVLHPNLNLQAGWALLANGRLKGYLVDDNGKVKLLPERTKRKPRKRPVKARQASKSGGKEG